MTLHGQIKNRHVVSDQPTESLDGLAATVLVVDKTDIPREP